MIDENAMREIERLNKLYKERWQKEVDYTIMPPGMDQRKLVIILRRIVDTGESLLVGYHKVSF